MTKRAIKRIKKNKSGFTVAELMATTIILLLSTSLITSAITIASRKFYSQISVAEAQMLCASISTSLQDEMTTATDITTASDGTITSYRSARHGLSVVSISHREEVAVGEDGSGADYYTQGLSAVAVTATEPDPESTDKDELWKRRGMVTISSLKDNKDGTYSIVTDKEPFKLISTGAYEIEGGPAGSLCAGVTMRKGSNGAIYITVSVYSTNDIKSVIAKKSFHVGMSMGSIT